MTLDYSSTTSTTTFKPAILIQGTVLKKNCLKLSDYCLLHSPEKSVANHYAI